MSRTYIPVNRHTERDRILARVAAARRPKVSLVKLVSLVKRAA